MLNEDIKKAIMEKCGENDEIRTLVAARDVTALVAKLKEAGFDVTEGDVAEALIGTVPLNDDELTNVAGGGCCWGNAGPYGCGPGSCHSDNG